MAKHATYVYLGLPHSGGDRIAAALHEHAELLAAPNRGGVQVTSRSVDETFRAAVELRREHKAWGLRRKDVEGVWAGICRRTVKARTTTVTGHHLLSGATEAEIDLTVDGLRGTDLHLVVTVAAPDARLSAFPDDHDLADVLARWRRVVTSPDRVHVLVCDPADPDPAWHQLGRVLGADTSGLAVPPRRIGEVDTHALRLLAEGTASLAADQDLVRVVEGWAKLVADEGYDVRGDLGGLVRLVSGARQGVDPAHTASDGAALDALGEALSESLAEVTRLRARTRELEQANAKLARKKRKLKQRLADAAG